MTQSGNLIQPFLRVSAFWGKPSIDLFALRLNFQLRPFVSSKPDPQAFAALSMSWTEHNFYALLPFPLINRVLKKTEQDQSHGVIIVPVWTTQIWFPHLLRMLADHPVLLPCYPQLLTLPTNRHLRHPLHKLKLMAAICLGFIASKRSFEGSFNCYRIYPCIIRTPILDCTLKKKKKEAENRGSGYEKIA